MDWRKLIGYTKENEQTENEDNAREMQEMRRRLKTLQTQVDVIRRQQG